MPATAQFDTSGMASRLRSGMTVGQVLLTLGYRPNLSPRETTCRRENGEPFVCRIWTYRTDLQELHIYFRYSDAQHEWVVYSWQL